MERFVNLRILSKEADGPVNRWYNLRYIRQVQEDTLDVWLHGATRAMKVSADSMQELVRVMDGSREDKDSFPVPAQTCRVSEDLAARLAELAEEMVKDSRRHGSWLKRFLRKD